MKSIILASIFLTLSCTPYSGKKIVNDVTKLNPIKVRKVLTPQSSTEISKAIKDTTGAISIGGGRFSMGGQTATENSLHLDMRKYNKILSFDKKKKQVTVQSGIRWRDLQEQIDKDNLSIKIMQTYANFTVGGSLSVNCHGRYIGEGPVIRSVESIKIILADGKEVLASRQEHQDLFFSAIGGYGGIGVISEVTLNLVDNEKIRREIVLKPAS